MRHALAALLLLASCTCAALPPNVELVETFHGINQYRLKSNGMPILLVQDRTSPVFTFLVVYHIGSRDEAPGNTGSAHLLEHLIANKSTENFGRAKGHKTFFEVLYEAGASTNMTTWVDRMTGFSTLSSDKLELAMRIEADRLGRALILDSERQSEMSVVRNEFEIGENEPWRALQKAVIAAAIQAHPYHWSTIGYRSDIEGVTTEKLREHYKAYFWPNNAHAILVGDFDTEDALASFERQFGGFARSPHATDAEVEAQKSYFAGRFQVDLGSNAGIAAALIDAEKFGFGPQHLDEFPQRIRAVTPAAANAAMRKYIYADKLHVIVAGDLDALPD